MSDGIGWPTAFAIAVGIVCMTFVMLAAAEKGRAALAAEVELARIAAECGGHFGQPQQGDVLND